MTELRLYLGRKFTGIVVWPDAKWPSMYRVHWADRPPSIMVNRTRAKDAAMGWAGREAHSTLGLTWKESRKPVGVTADELEPTGR